MSYLKSNNNNIVKNNIRKNVKNAVIGSMLGVGITTAAMYSPLAVKSYNYFTQGNNRK